MWHKAIWRGHPMRLELTRVGLLVELANHYTTRGALLTRMCHYFLSPHPYVSLFSSTSPVCVIIFFHLTRMCHSFLPPHPYVSFFSSSSPVCVILFFLLYRMRHSFLPPHPYASFFSSSSPVCVILFFLLTRMCHSFLPPHSYVSFFSFSSPLFFISYSSASLFGILFLVALLPPSPLSFFASSN